MSWEQWTDNLVAQNVYHAAIFGRDGNPWSCKNLTATPAEVKAIEEAIRLQKQDIFTSGVTLNNEKWAALRLEENVLVIKGKDDKIKEKTMTVALTKQALVFGCNKDGTVQANHVRDATEKLAASLETAGY
ncbi:profilin-like [Littorina saxatilis]|uniref:Profilin n=1 Tax=Littorina saxatilis TaxID=31220 RepID=A0AAN9GPD6_9CAEN|eukprot:GHVL01010421.1.p1 GENE.GHVL01010421.1~~GHVL01010421.1.p1  ORF type:complete len:131 (+),score=6.51 GHVL01010421.1:178-570(+)